MNKLAILPGLQKEWYRFLRNSNVKSYDKVFEEFNKCWEDFDGFILKYKNNYDIDLTEVWNEFKLFWEIDKEESTEMFKEMELLSENMLCEWRMKYNFDYPHVYEKIENGWSIQSNYHLKSKVQLWDEFKEIWEIDIYDYNENKYKEMNKYVNEIQCEDIEDIEDIEDFYSYRENSNYHSFDSYSLLEQFEICERYDNKK